MKRPTAVVMNMFYTGLGIARSLGENGVPVIGLTSQHGVYGNFTRYAKTVFCPDSRHNPEALLEFLLRLGKELGHQAVIFPTRDDDVVFLDRFSEQLKPLFKLTVPANNVLNQCLDKWQTHLAAVRAGVPSPKCWRVEGEQQLRGLLPDLAYPCVLKPVAAHHWRSGRNWNIVGGRKAIGISSSEELITEYAAIARANRVVLIQEMIPGGDDCLVIAACYMDHGSNLIAGFNTQKLVQEPEGLGTGCIVQSVDRQELFEPTVRLLQELRYTGIAEVEYKWDAVAGEYKLIEINPRPWDQHRLGKACGTDLVFLAYCEHAGMKFPEVQRRFVTQKWIAEDAFLATALRLVWHRDPKLRFLFKSARGQRTYAIWSAKDPLPFLGYFLLLVIPKLAKIGVQVIWRALTASLRSKKLPQKEAVVYEKRLENGQIRG